MSISLDPTPALGLTLQQPLGNSLDHVVARRSADGAAVARILAEAHIEQIDMLVPGARSKVVVFEFGAGDQVMNLATSNALAIHEAQRIGDKVLSLPNVMTRESSRTVEIRVAVSTPSVGTASVR